MTVIRIDDNDGNSTNASEPESASRILRLRNLDGDLSPRVLLDFLWEAGFHPEDVQIGLIDANDFDLVEAYIGLQNWEAVKAYQWAEKRMWRGKELDAALVPHPRKKNLVVATTPISV